MEVKDIIKSKRIECGLTMKDLADKVGVSEGTISRWESGEIANMRRDKIFELSKVLQISPLILLGMEEYPVASDIGDTCKETNSFKKTSDTYPPKIRAAARDMMSLSEEDQELAIAMIKTMSNRGKEAKEAKKH